MKHKRTHKILGREAHHRRALLRQLVGDLLLHGALVTTPAKAQALRRQIEPLITSVKKTPSLALGRATLARVRTATEAETLVALAKVHQARAGGYTRITKLPSERHDSAPQSRIEIIDFDKV